MKFLNYWVIFCVLEISWHPVPMVILTGHIFRDVIFVKWLDEINSIMSLWHILTNYLPIRLHQFSCHQQSVTAPVLCSNVTATVSSWHPTVASCCSRFSTMSPSFFLHGTRVVWNYLTVCNSAPCLSPPFPEDKLGIMVSIFVSLPPWHIIDIHRY